MKGLIISGSRNIFTVRSLGRNNSDTADSTIDNEEFSHFECRIKGKVLDRSNEGLAKNDYYNPLAPGDIVEFESGLISSLYPRKNYFARLNIKGNNTQILGANIDLLLCVTTISSPPFRARFIDRVLLQAEHFGIPVLILVNKLDLFDACPTLDVRQYVFETQQSGASMDENIKERLDDFKRMGYNLHFISCKTKDGIDQLRTMLRGKTSMLVGQSAVGKSSILNELFPNANLKTGMLNRKYDRGNHTTVQSNLFEDKNISIIDTPGIRQFIPCGIEKNDVINLMKDFAPFAGQCEYGISCTHQSERGCKIQSAIEHKKIHEDRFVSFVKIRQEIERTRIY
ncbi:MAG: ribosome small subunit-dependent GTPase A [Termitinemataceae bacterium]|nr:MAG: ribosome small subunit-dependent GTPase A [Termitinemataceae bacterium]